MPGSGALNRWQIALLVLISAQIHAALAGGPKPADVARDRIAAAFKTVDGMRASLELHAALRRSRGAIVACLEVSFLEISCHGTADVQARAVQSSLQARSPEEAKMDAQLAGSWSGDTFSLTIDVERAQANMGPDLPFRWQRYRLVEAQGQTAVFVIGAELFEARLDSGEMTLTSTSFRGERMLTRR